MQEHALFNPDTRFIVTDKPRDDRREFHYPDGLCSFMEEIEHEVQLGPGAMRPYHLHSSNGVDFVEAVLLDRRFGARVLHAFVNRRRLADGGNHIAAFERACAEIPEFLGDGGWRCADRRAGDVLSGATLLLALRLENPELLGATRSRLGDPRAEEMVYQMVRTQLPEQIKEAAGESE